jgi:phospholipase C
MENRSHGYLHYTRHEAEGNQARVIGFFSREQTQAAIAAFTEFSLPFFGLGRGIELGLRAYPVRAAQALTAPRSAARRAAMAAAATSPVAAAAASPMATEGPAPIGTIARMRPTGPRRPIGDMRDPFGHPIIDPGDAPEPPGGGSGGALQAAVRVELFAPGIDEPVQIWELPEEVTDQTRKLTYDPPGFPTPDAPVHRLGWWRVTVTPQGPGPTTIYVQATATMGRVPLRTTAVPVRLFNTLFRVAIEALIPRAWIEGSELKVTMGKELAEMLGVSQEIYTKDISPLSSSANLVSLKITAESGKKLKDIARERGRMTATLDQRVKDDAVALRIQAAFENASASIFGVDLATLDGEFGDLFLAFDRSLNYLTPASFIAVDLFQPLEMAYDAYIAVKGALLDMGQTGPSAQKAVNEAIELYFRYPTGDAIADYVRLVLGRAIGQRAVVHEASFAGDAWQVRYSDDPVLPPESTPWRPWRPGMIGLGGAVGGLTSADMAPPSGDTETPPQAEPAEPAPSSDPLGVMPPEFHVEGGDALARLDRHQTLVVIMMENRSYDHMLGGLAAARPRAEGGYDGPPSGASNASAGGFRERVPLVMARKIGMGTQIPVSPNHHYFEHGEDHLHPTMLEGPLHYPVPFQIGDGTDETAGSGGMAGFARDLLRRSDSPQLAMTMYGEAELPVYYRLADEFCVCDRWFCAHPGPTWPNRFATIMGSIPELDNFEIDDPRIGFLEHRTIFDALTDAGIDWRVFESDLSLIRMFDRFRLDNRHVVPIDDRADGLQATLHSLQPLPRVLFVEPNFVDIPPVNTASDDHPPADLAAGQAFISWVCDTIWDSGHFRDCLVLITYDEHGGFYDHVPPPGTPKAPPSPLGPRSKLHPEGPEYLGPRVPTFILSPYMSAGKAETTIFDHTSILKTILVHNRERLPQSAFSSFGERVNAAAHIGQALDLAQARQAPQTFDPKRARPTGGRGIHDMFVDMDLLATDTGGVAHVAAIPPRSVTVIPRGPDTKETVEARDYHAALRGVLKPRL